MFHYFNGKLVYCQLNTAVIDCGGVGYKLTVSATTLSKIAGHMEETVKLFSYLAVREDAMELYGFYGEAELESFKLLTSVSGIGPKAAIAILSVFTPEKLAAAIAAGDTRAISRAQGVGGKTAARVVLELKDKFKIFGEDDDGGSTVDTSVSESVTGGGFAEATEVLAVLGYSRSEIASALKNANPAWDSEAVVKHALKQLASGK